MQKRVIMQHKWLLREIGPSICAWNTTHHLVLTVSASDLRATNLSYFWQLTDVSCFLRAASTVWTFSIGPVSLAIHPLILWIAIYLTFLAMSKQTLSIRKWTRVAEVAREHGWHPPKSLDSDENFKPEHTLLCRELRFVAISALFGDLLAKKCLFGSKTVFLGQEVHY